MKTSDLIGIDLDYWVARARGIPAELLNTVGGNRPSNWCAISITGWGMYRPSTREEDGNSLIHEHNIATVCRYRGTSLEFWSAQMPIHPVQAKSFDGRTRLVAACRAFVESVYGDEVPDECDESGIEDGLQEAA